MCLLILVNTLESHHTKRTRAKAAEAQGARVRAAATRTLRTGAAMWAMDLRRCVVGEVWLRVAGWFGSSGEQVDSAAAAYNPNSTCLALHPPPARPPTSLTLNQSRCCPGRAAQQRRPCHARTTTRCCAWRCCCLRHAGRPRPQRLRPPPQLQQPWRRHLRVEWLQGAGNGVEQCWQCRA